MAINKAYKGLSGGTIRGDYPGAGGHQVIKTVLWPPSSML